MTWGRKGQAPILQFPSPLKDGLACDEQAFSSWPPTNPYQGYCQGYLCNLGPLAESQRCQRTEIEPEIVRSVEVWSATWQIGTRIRHNPFKESPHASPFCFSPSICAYPRGSRSAALLLQRLVQLPPLCCASCCDRHPLLRRKYQQCVEFALLKRKQNIDHLRDLCRKSVRPENTRL